MPPTRLSFLYKAGLSLPKLKRAMEYIDANLAEDIRLEGSQGS